ncbi:MAG: hypothetical protein AAFY14_00070 [Pseudomonadota bacterium]
MAIVLLKATVASVDLQAVLLSTGNDDMMRLLAIRDWLGGQGWYDTTQYRVTPPEGVVMHWSRYLDLAIAAILVPLSAVFAMPLAEMLTVVIWPTLLMLVLIVTIGFGTRHVFGTGPACLAMLTAVVWPFTSDFYFGAGHIDHHNVQVLMLVAMTLAAIWPDRALAAGVTSGIAAAFSLAIGLENLLYILALGLLLLLRTIFRVGDDQNQRLWAFCLSLLIAAVLLWVGQVAPSRLLLPVCDQLGTPILSLIGIAVVASVLATFRTASKPLVSVMISAGLTATGCALAWPILGPCIANPYATLPIEVQTIISGSITEALPAVDFATRFPFLFNQMMTPVLSAVAVGTGMWWLNRKSETSRLPQHDAVAQLIVLSLVGLLASFSQVRLLAMTSAVVPLLAGYGLWGLFRRWRQTRSPGGAVVLIIAGVLILAPRIMQTPFEPFLPRGQASASDTTRSCATSGAMSGLNNLPQSSVLSPMNLGPLLLITTHHNALSSPYHRSAIAVANGLLPFQMAEAEMKQYVTTSGADYLILCAGANHGDSFATMLANGSTADWLEPVTVDASGILVFAVRSTATD